PSSSKNGFSKEKNYQFFANPNEVFIMGGDSFKKGTILREQGSIESFLDEIKRKKYKLVYIRDEAHIASKINSKDEKVQFEAQMQNNA
ncbi:hypothetical protein C0075_26105, partial [Rhizobium sp. KAs_5_22]